MKKTSSKLGALVVSFVLGALALSGPAQAGEFGPDNVITVDQNYAVEESSSKPLTAYAWQKIRVVNAPANEYNYVSYTLRGCHGKVLDHKEFNRPGTYTFTIGKKNGYLSKVLGPKPVLEIKHFWSDGYFEHVENYFPRSLTKWYRSHGVKCGKKRGPAKLKVVPQGWVAQHATKDTSTVLDPQVDVTTGMTRAALSATGVKKKAKVIYRWSAGNRIVKEGPRALTYTPSEDDAGQTLRAQAIISKQGRKDRVQTLNFGTVRAAPPPEFKEGRWFFTDGRGSTLSFTARGTEIRDIAGSVVHPHAPGPVHFEQTWDAWTEFDDGGTNVGLLTGPLRWDGNPPGSTRGKVRLSIYFDTPTTVKGTLFVTAPALGPDFVFYDFDATHGGWQSP